ncbi:unnamed protein product [Paramecium pentaurelia]|uniref:Transmembrane protein n=1 Tax=Paramecium pentaurelia TaxID=43138 RepID=A0A8S1SZQ5_9CILI|nr:unnamed protein product [Paramecium pentaurelia]
MQIKCTQADHRTQQILGFCIGSSCANQRPYCNFCIPSTLNIFISQHNQTFFMNGLSKDFLELIVFKRMFNNLKQLLIVLQACSFLFLTLIFHNYHNQEYHKLTNQQKTQVKWKIVKKYYFSNFINQSNKEDRFQTKCLEIQRIKLIISKIIIYKFDIITQKN